MENKSILEEVKKILDKTYPETPVPLHHKDNFSLLVAVLLSAQCTDERVNEITPKLFSVASDPVSMSKVSVNKIYKITNNGNSWVKAGNNITGDIITGTSIGHSVSLSSSGQEVAVASGIYKLIGNTCANIQ